MLKHLKKIYLTIIYRCMLLEKWYYTKYLKFAESFIISINGYTFVWILKKRTYIILFFKVHLKHLQEDIDEIIRCLAEVA
jgi:hypothetical protein